MHHESGDYRERWDRIKAEMEAARDAGDWMDAFELSQESLQLARESEDPELQDLAICNRAGIAAGLGLDTTADFNQIRRIISNGATDYSRYWAAYTLTYTYYQIGDSRKAKFYGRSMVRLARILGDDELVAWSHNLLGAILTGQNDIEEGSRCFEVALDKLEGPSESQALGAVLTNLGYCRCLQGDAEAAVSLISRGHRMLRRLKSAPTLMVSSADYSFVMLELDRPRAALRHAERAIGLSERLGTREDRRNAYFLAGEAANRLERYTEAQAFYHRATEGYQNQAFLTRFLLSIDVRSMINLRA